MKRKRATNRFDARLKNEATKAFNRYLEEINKVNKNPIVKYNYEDFENHIASNKNARSSWKEAVDSAVETSFGYSFNKYGGKKAGKSDIQVRSWKQAQHIYDRMVEFGVLPPEVTVDDILRRFMAL